MRAADLKAVKGGESALAMAKRRYNTVDDGGFFGELETRWKRKTLPHFGRTSKPDFIWMGDVS